MTKITVMKKAHKLGILFFKIPFKKYGLFNPYDFEKMNIYYKLIC